MLIVINANAIGSRLSVCVQVSIIGVLSVNDSVIVLIVFMLIVKDCALDLNC